MANKSLKIKQYRRVIKAYAKNNNISLDSALYDFYNSHTYEKLDKEIGDYHLEGDEYIADDISIEMGYLKTI